MPERDNDRLEQFFRKATSRPDVSFHEEDWKKLESRLDAQDAAVPTTTGISKKSVIAITLSALLLIMIATWITSYYELSLVKKPAKEQEMVQKETYPKGEKAPQAGVTPEADEASGRSANIEGENGNAGTKNNAGSRARVQETETARTRELASRNAQQRGRRLGGTPEQQDELKNTVGNNGVTTSLPEQIDDVTPNVERPYIATIPKAQIARDWMQVATHESRNKQKAMVNLPGAEEGETGVAELVDAREETSEQPNYTTTPRLSLLLSFAPDFSSTSLNRYSAPGTAFGGMIHYHVGSRWSVAAGIIKNQKQYTGKGADYTPPTGYWRYYTNGKVPSTIDGECSVVEFPLMVQYTLYQTGKSRFLAGAGTSSYLMLDESYRYYFDEPNPGTREGWASKDQSRFMFNMVNFTLAYERQIAPGLMLGVEPYLKIPIEEIGWTNLKLFSTGASISMRYVILRKKHASVPEQSRGPD